MADIENLKVEKRDGKMWDFEREKIKKSVTNAGATPDQAEKITQDVEIWARSVKSGVVKTSDVRSKVIESLRAVNPTAAETYEAYKKPGA